MAKISVIVPVYNVEEYLKRCVDSILAQTFTDFELLLVDDGSTDSSGKICDEYAKEDSRIKVFHKENGGLSSARNYGIEQATSPYIGFIDSDDYIECDMYEILYKNIVAEDAQMSMCSLYDIYNGKPRKVIESPSYMCVDVPTAIKIVMEAKINSVYAVNKLYKRELFSEIRYPVERIAEDAFVIIELLLNCKKIAITTQQKYYYVHRQNSITTSQFKQKDLDVIDAYHKNYDLIKNNYPKLLDVAQMRLCWAHFYALDKIIVTKENNDKNIQKRLIDYLRKNYLFILKDSRFNLSRKVAMSLLMVNKGLYRICVKINLRRLKV